MAVYTDVSDEALSAFLAGYDLGGLVAFRGIAEGVENSNFSLRTEAGDFILTLYERRVEAAELPWFLGLMRHLAAAGIVCPQPVAARDGSSLGVLCGRPAAITTFLEGVWPRRVRIEQCGPLGEALGRLHAAGRDFTPARANALGVGAWRPLFEMSSTRADEVQAGLGAEVALALDGVERDWPDDLPRGQIHADLFPDNVFFLGERVSGLIDFYFACTDLLAYDLAVVMNAWCFEADGAFNATKARAVLRGYERVRVLEAAERAAMPVLAAGAALRFLLTRLHDRLHPVPGIVMGKDPLDYLRRLRFHRSVGIWAGYAL